jgi:hypothetical protein
MMLLTGEERGWLVQLPVTDRKKQFRCGDESSDRSENGGKAEVESHGVTCLQQKVMEKDKGVTRGEEDNNSPQIPQTKPWHNRPPRRLCWSLNGMSGPSLSS